MHQQGMAQPAMGMGGPMPGAAPAKPGKKKGGLGMPIILAIAGGGGVLLLLVVGLVVWMFLGGSSDEVASTGTGTFNPTGANTAGNQPANTGGNQPANQGGNPAGGGDLSAGLPYSLVAPDHILMVRIDLKGLLKSKPLQGVSPQMLQQMAGQSTPPQMREFMQKQFEAWQTLWLFMGAPEPTNPRR